MIKPLLLAGCLLASFTPTLSAAESWNFEITPYLWGISQSGQTGARNINGSGNDLILPIDVGFDDIIKNLDGAFLLNGLATKDDWLFAIDSVYMKVKTDKNSAEGVFNKNLQLISKQLLIDFITGYRVINDESLQLYSYVGARYADLETTNTLSLTPNITDADGIQKSMEIGDSWVDPLVGIYSIKPLSENFDLELRAELSGFGVASDLSWLAAINFKHQLSESWSLRYAYRYLSIEHDDNDFVFDVDTSGLLFGATFKF